MMDGPGFMPYSSRTPTSAPLQRPTMSPQYGITAPYNAGPITTASGPQSIPAPHYPTHSAYPYGSYHNSPPVPALGSPFKQEYPNSRHPGMDEDGHRGSTYTRNLKMSDDYPARSPSARSGSVSTTKSAGANPNSASKCITLNETLNPADQVNFNTDIDKLMKVIQDTNKRSSSQSDTPLQTPKSERVGEAQSPASPDSVGSAHTDTADLKKKYVCDGPNCNKRFSQKTHLQIHARTHSGEKPFRCDFAGCGLTFSQRGNLRTHMRRHTGEKPFRCSMCKKEFAQKGNVRSHEETHRGMKPFTCRLDNCNKTFSQLGNMKTHQNTYHAPALAKLTQIFVEYAGAETIPEEHRDLFEYFKEHYKNSNKGIKGRGKDRKVATENKSEPKMPMSDMVTQYPQPARPVVRASKYGMMSGLANLMAPMPRSHQPAGYPVFGSDQEQQGPAPHMIYEDEQCRQMNFTTDRLY